MTGAGIKSDRLFGTKLKIFFSLAGRKRGVKFEIIKLHGGLVEI
jgi:hypothetical protein